MSSVRLTICPANGDGVFQDKFVMYAKLRKNVAYLKGKIALKFGLDPQDVQLRYQPSTSIAVRYLHDDEIIGDLGDVTSIQAYLSEPEEDDELKLKSRSEMSKHELYETIEHLTEKNKAIEASFMEDIEAQRQYYGEIIDHLKTELFNMNEEHKREIESLQKSHIEAVGTLHEEHQKAVEELCKPKALPPFNPATFSIISDQGQSEDGDSV